jgi:hypothetical protein
LGAPNISSGAAPGGKRFSVDSQKLESANRAPEGHSAAFSTKVLRMTDITMPISVRATRARLMRIALFLALLVLCCSAAATRVEDCRTVGGNFDNGFNSGFSIGPRMVCTTETMAAYSVEEALTFLKSK